MAIRSRVWSCIVLLVAALVVAAGCATGGDGSTQGGTTCTAPQIPCNGVCVDPTTDGQNCGACGTVCPAGQGCTNSACGACVAPQTACGDKCVVLGTDNKNCGACGASCGTNQVCSNGKCTTQCGSGLKTCGGSATSDAGAHDASSEASSDATIEASTDATIDAPAADAADDSSSPMDSGGVDAGGPLYCADTNNDPKNCGDCGVACSAGKACKMGVCQLDCPTGKHACNVSNLCIPDGTCCTNSDCAVTGQKCSGPGDMCKCPTGQKTCTANNSCIDSAACCTNTDCAGITGSTCSAPGGMCTCASGKKACSAAGACIDNTQCCTNSDCTAFGQTCTGVGAGTGGSCACPTGQKLCTASNSCIPNAACCTVADCPNTTEVMSTACTGGMCSVLTCVAGWVDVDGVYSNGCECQDSGNATACATPTAVGTLQLGQMVTKTGNLPRAGQDNWFQVTFAGTGNASYHPKVVLSANPNNAFLFDILDGCGGSGLACGDGGNATNRTIWEVSVTAGDPTGQTYAAVPAVGSGGTVWIRVHRVGGGMPSCDQFQLTISN